MLLEAANFNRRDAGTGEVTEPHLLAGPFRPRAGVLAARALDSMALYDPRQERYLTLNHVATRIWELLEDGQQAPAIVDRICEEYAAPIGQVAADVSAQLAEFLQGQLIELVTANCKGPVAPYAAADAGGGVNARRTGRLVREEVRVPPLLYCGMTIAWIKWLLRTRRFQGTISWIRAYVRQIPATANANLAEVLALEYAVALAGAFYPGRARCLEQSLALYLIARRQGIAVRYCQGVQLYPFEAHAWVQYRGQVINDVPEHIRHFARFPEQLL